MKKLLMIVVISCLMMAGLMSAEMVYVKGGSFMMGSNDGYDSEKPVHQVIVSDFMIGKYEVTQKEWKEVMGDNPSFFNVDDLPVDHVSWYDAVEYCNKRSIKEGLTPCYTINKNKTDPNNECELDELKWLVTIDWDANGYRLPTEAQWEYAARGGNKSKGYKYSGSDDIGAVAWFGANSDYKPHAVGGKQANELGLFDMSGNVYEWCWDWYDTYEKSQSSDPIGASSGLFRVMRGGSRRYDADSCRVAFRSNYESDYRDYDYGFRVSRAVK